MQHSCHKIPEICCVCVCSKLFWQLTWKDTYNLVQSELVDKDTNISVPTWLYHVESSWNVMAHGDAQEGKWRGNWQMEWVASTFHTTLEHGVSSITTADAHTSAASSQLNWSPRRFMWTCPFCRKMKSGFCVCAIIFQTQSTCALQLVF